MATDNVARTLLLLLPLFLYTVTLASSGASFDMVDQRILRHVAVKPGDRPEMMMMGGVQSGGSSSGQHGNDREMIQPTNETNIHGSSVTTSTSLVSNVNNSISNLSDSMLLWSQYVGRSRYVLEVDPEFVAKINPFWLQFDPPSAGEHYGLAAFYFLMMLFGVIGNALVIFMFNRYRSLRTPANYLVVNLAVADLLIMLEAPLFIYNSIYQGPAFGSIGCTVYALMGAIGGTVAIGTLTVISIDRYNVVVFPLNPNRSTTKLKCYITIAFTWAYGLLFAGLPALEIGLSRYTAEGFLTACSFDYLDRTYKARVFMFVYFVCAWVLPLLIISYCYARILFAVVNANSIQSNKTKNKTEVKLAGVVVGIIGLWFIAWTPYAVVAMLGVFGYEHYLTPLNSMLPAVFAKIAASIDPYFYAMNHPRYRQMLERMCCNRGAEQGNSQYQTSHYNTRGPSRGGDSEAGENESAGPSVASRGRNSSVSNMPSGGARAGSIKQQQQRTGGLAGLKRQASHGDDSSMEISVEM